MDIYTIFFFIYVLDWIGSAIGYIGAFIVICLIATLIFMAFGGVFYTIRYLYKKLIIREESVKVEIDNTAKTENKTNNK